MRCYRLGIMADRLNTGLMIDFEDQPTQLGFMRAIGLRARLNRRPQRAADTRDSQRRDDRSTR